MTDQEIEDFLAEKVMGWRFEPDDDELFERWMAGDWPKDYIAIWRKSWHPLGEISQAWQVLEKCTDPDALGLTRQHGTGASLLMRFGDHFQRANLWVFSAEEAARHICMIAVMCVYDSAENAWGP